MAATETIKWTAVPNGLDPTQSYFQLSVLISPELSGGETGTLEDFPDFQDWPGTLTGTDVEWSVELSTSNPDIGQRVVVPFDSTFNSTGAASDLWQILFPPSLSYGPPDPGQDLFRNLAIASYPAADVSGFLQDQFTNYSLTEVPTVSTLQAVYGPISDVLVGVTAQARMNALAAQRAARSRGNSVPHANDFSGAGMADAFAAQAYYHMPGAGAPPVPQVPAIDFNRAMTFIGQHGVLQRALGLVFDLQIPVGDFDKIVPILEREHLDAFVSAILTRSDSRSRPDIFVSPPFPTASTPIVPRTQCDLSSTGFEAHAATANINGGQLVVVDPTSSTPYVLAHAVDFDGAGLRASTFATQLRLTEAPATIDERYTAAYLPLDPSTPMAPPMLRSNGLTLTEVNRGVNFASTLARAFLLFDAARQGNPIPDLTAEDLVRGFILDVVDDADGNWRSTAEWLCEYVATDPTGSILPQQVQGPTSPPYSESSTQAPPRVQSSPTDPSTMQANLSEVILHYNGWSNAVPRPGTVLQDADSQVSSPDPIPFSQLSITVSAPQGRLPPLRFGHTYAMRVRLVDVANNAVALTAGAAVGDTAGRVTAPMVYARLEAIGSPDVYGQSIPRPAESIRRLVIRDIDSATPSARALAPQRCAEPFAEWHGMFDIGGVLSGSPDPTRLMDTYNEIVGRESAQYPDPPGDPTTAPTTISLTSPVPYLPDPLARGGVLTITSGTLDGQTVPFDFSPSPGGWPHYRPFGLQLTPTGNAADDAVQTVAVDTVARMITFALTEADTVTMNLSSTCNADDIPLFGLSSWVAEFDPAAAADGQYWAITPAVTLELIFAVQKPLLTPELPSFPTPARSPGDTFAELEAGLRYSPKSTSSIDLLADWGDPVDDPVHNLPVQGPGAPNPALRQTANSPVVTMPTTTTPLASAGTQLYSAVDTVSARHEFFDTKHRNVTYHAVATSQFSEFYPPGTEVTSPTATPVLVDILSSARPDSPDVEFVVPIYGWQLQKKGAITVSTRSPSALRVFIKRPWWSSGIDEQLGVVTWPGAEPGSGQLDVLGRRHEITLPTRPIGVVGLSGPAVFAAIPDAETQYVSDWGADPVFAGSALPSLHPQLASFTNAISYGRGLSIDESASITVNVAGHPVVFDATRGLWYCDIAIDIGAAYTPMIRLALARYQPNSIAGVELSRIVLADIMSLDPGRTATVVRKSATELSSVTLSGYSYTGAAGATGVAPGSAELIVQRRQTEIHDEDLGWEAVGDPIQLSPIALRDNMTAWTTRDVKLPAKAKVRLCINQYEVLPTDRRSPTTGFYALLEAPRELRLLHQDLIPV